MSESHSGEAGYRFIACDNPMPSDQVAGIRILIAVRDVLEAARASAKLADLDLIVGQEVLRLAANVPDAPGREAANRTSFLRECLVTGVCELTLSSEGDDRGGADGRKRRYTAAGRPITEREDAMNSTKLIRSKVDLSRLGPVVIIPDDARSTAKEVRVRASQALRLSIGRLVDKTALVDRDLMELFRNGDLDAARVALAAMNDLALTIASAVPANRREACLKVSYLSGHRGSLGTRQTTQPAMFDAAIELECARWGLKVAPPAQGSAALH